MLYVPQNQCDTSPHFSSSERDVPHLSGYEIKRWGYGYQGASSQYQVARKKCKLFYTDERLYKIVVGSTCKNYSMNTSIFRCATARVYLRAKPERQIKPCARRVTFTTNRLSQDQGVVASVHGNSTSAQLYSSLGDAHSWHPRCID